MGLLNFLKPKKQIEPKREEEIRKLEKEVGGLLNPNLTAIKKYLARIEDLEKNGYDISKYQTAVTIFRDISIKK